MSLISKEEGVMDEWKPAGWFNETANFRAQDENGFFYEYDNKPYPKNGSWRSVDGVCLTIPDGDKGAKNPPADYTQTLEVRVRQK